MSKAVRFEQLGGPEVLRIEDVADRHPGAGEVLLAVEAVGLNRAESMYYHGLYMEQPHLPSGVGYEAVGVVSAVGPGVDASLVGKRFGTIPGYSMNQYPVLAERAVVPASVLAPIPDSFSAAEGAAVWMQYCTAYGALVPFGKVSSGDFVIITAASSSVGLAAIQIVKAQGGISIATCPSVQTTSSSRMTRTCRRASRRSPAARGPESSSTRSGAMPSTRSRRPRRPVAASSCTACSPASRRRSPWRPSGGASRCAAIRSTSCGTRPSGM